MLPASCSPPVSRPSAGVTGLAGTASAATPAALPIGTILDAGGAGAIANSYIVSFKDGSPAADRVAAGSAELAKRYGGTVEGTYTSAVRGFHATMTRTQARAWPPTRRCGRSSRTPWSPRTAPRPIRPGAWTGSTRQACRCPSSYTYRRRPTSRSYVLDTGIRISHPTSAAGPRTATTSSTTTRSPTTATATARTSPAPSAARRTAWPRTSSWSPCGCWTAPRSGSYSGIIEGIDWVTKNAVKPAVANMSLGGANSATLDAAVKRSIAAGVTYAVAAGNDNTRRLQAVAGQHAGGHHGRGHRQHRRPGVVLQLRQPASTSSRPGTRSSPTRRSPTPATPR